MRSVYAVITNDGIGARFVEIEDAGGASVRIESSPYPNSDTLLRIGPLLAPEDGGQALVLEGEDLWRVYDLVAARAELLSDVSNVAMADVGGGPWQRLQARIGSVLGRPVPCTCPRGMRFHANNCPYAPNEEMRQ